MAPLHDLPIRRRRSAAARAPALALLVPAVLLLLPGPARAEAERDRFSAGGYFRVATRPDLQGGTSKLGYWNLSGRLLNEGPWAALELKLDVLQRRPDANRPWTSVHAKIEGGSLLTTDPLRGGLSDYRLTQLYVLAGDVLLDKVTWQLGTLDTWLGDLGLYDMKPAQILYETVGAAARYGGEYVDVVLAAGDSGWYVRGPHYDTILTAGGLLKLKLGRLELGAGGQLFHEPAVKGNRFAPYATPNVNYEDYVRREVVKMTAQRKYPDGAPVGAMILDPPEARSSTSGKVVAYLGFGGLGPLVWSSFYGSLQLRHPDNFYTENYEGREFTIYAKDLTDERWQLLLGNEARFELVPGRLDAAWGLLYGWSRDDDNRIAPGEDNRTFYSTVVRLQAYASGSVHFLAETSLANEISHNGNLFRDHYDSVFRSTDGNPDTRGLELGDDDRRFTWQLKIGPVLSPTGFGIYARPAIRLLYGMQYSTQNNAWGNSFVDSLDQYNVFGSAERHWHHVVALEAEAWF